jgi:drug/metabolite transporter (DMT)-like permease
MNPVVLIVASVALGVAGQLALKSGLTQLGSLTIVPGRLPIGSAFLAARRVLLNRRIWAGLGLYGLSMLFWLVSLSRVELGYAYPFISLSYALILLAAWVLFGERLTLHRVLGVAAICLGVYAVAAG